MTTAEIEDTTPARRQALRDHGLAKMVVTTLNDGGEMAVTVRILPAEDARRIMADLDSSSVG